MIKTTLITLIVLLVLVLSATVMFIMPRKNRSTSQLVEHRVKLLPHAIEMVPQAFDYDPIISAVTANSRLGLLFAVDVRNCTVYAFSFAGEKLYEFGRRGVGPGEFLQGYAIACNDAKDTIYLLDRGCRRISEYTIQGSFVRFINLKSSIDIQRGMIVDNQGRLFMWQQNQRGISGEDGGFIIRRLDTDSDSLNVIVAPEPSLHRQTLSAINNNVHTVIPVPYSVREIWRLGPNLSLVGNTSSEYTLRIVMRDGIEEVVRRPWIPVPVSSKEREWLKKLWTRVFRTSHPEWKWNGPRIPKVKPAITDLLIDQVGRIWVKRYGESQLLNGSECSSLLGIICWSSTYHWDLLNDSGDYLGIVDIPSDIILSDRTWIGSDFIVCYENSLLEGAKVLVLKIQFDAK
jgi:hypothetical protein